MVSKTIASEVQIAILGLGTVGKGVKTILEENQNSISENIYRLSGVRTTIKIKKILVRNLPKHSDFDFENKLYTTDFQEIENDKEIKTEKQLTPFQKTERLLSGLAMLKGAVDAKEMLIKDLKKEGILIQKRETGVNVQSSNVDLS